MKAKSELDKYLSSQTFCATRSDIRINGRQFVGCNGNSVNEIILLIYIKEIIVHSTLKTTTQVKQPSNSYENYAQSKRAFMNSTMLSTEGVSRKSWMRSLSKASGFSLMYFSSEKKYRSESSGMSFCWFWSYFGKVIEGLLLTFASAGWLQRRARSSLRWACRSWNP